LRGFAAIAVVANHAFRAVTVNKPDWISLPAPIVLGSDRLVNIGAFGVDIFFVLSGFLMIFIAKPYVARVKPVGDFIAHRLIRIWPLYFLVTFFQCALYLRVAIKSGVIPYDLRPFRLMSFLFVPSFNESHLLQPIIGPGWTLNYEMLFYACFAVALFIGRKNVLAALAGLLVTLFVAGTLLPSTSVLGGFLSNSILFEFLFGAIIAEFFLNGGLAGIRASWWIGAGLLSLAVLSYWPGDGNYRVFTRGIPAAILFLGMLGLSENVAWPKLFIVFGNASYSIYLTHSFVVYQVSDRILRFCAGHAMASFAAALTSLLAIVIAVIFGIVVYYMVEKPLLGYCKGLYSKRSIGAVSEAASST